MKFKYEHVQDFIDQFKMSHNVGHFLETFHKAGKAHQLLFQHTLQARPALRAPGLSRAQHPCAAPLWIRRQEETQTAWERYQWKTIKAGVQDS